MLYKKTLRINIMLVSVTCIHVGTFATYDSHVDCLSDENHIIIICISNCMHEYHMWQVN